jgi:cation diffusion facilitator CzcD-associated flavoprotein CzcO
VSDGVAPEQTQVVIVGAGFAGLGMAIQLTLAGFDDLVVLERADSLGGVWRDNRYPGVACDVESHLYSYSFAPNPDWTRTFAPQREILAYLEACADRFDVRRRIRFGEGLSEARFDEASGRWQLTTTRGRRLDAKVLISAAGHALSQPVIPKLPGQASFAGHAFHSARWDADVPLEGKRVAVIGTGASAIQIVPALAKRVAHLDVYQRTPAWVVPKPDHEIPAWQRRLYRRFPKLQQARREAIFWKREAMVPAFVRRPALMTALGKLVERHIARSIADPTLRQRLTPRYVMGCKRILPSNDFYPAVQRPNVTLVDVPIRALEPEGIRTEDGVLRPVDVIVWATGFEAAEAHAPFLLHGRDGRTLDETWSDGIEAYLGTTVANFPNLFLLVGPNVGLGHTSMILMMEAQFAYVLDALRTMRERHLATVEVLPEVQRRYNEVLQRRLAKTVWNTGGCVSWYRTRAGKNTTLWPGSTLEFRRRTRRFVAADYRLSE